MKALRCACGLLLLTAQGFAGDDPVDASSLAGKVLLGYQGWFRCPGDGEPKASWKSWAKGIPSPESLTVDLYPDLSDFSPRDLCRLPGFTIAGQPAYLYSARNRNVVETHFRWMREHGLDGVLVQRFVSTLANARAGKDQVLRNVAAAAERYGRVFAVEYDVTGADPRTFASDLQQDWKYLVEDLKITANPRYLRHRGKPLLSVWGMGFDEARNPPRDPAEARALVAWFQSGAPAHLRVTYMGGVPSRWRTRERDAQSAAGWDAVYTMMDVIQPWTVGRYRDEAGADNWAKEFVKPDLDRTRARRQLYMPVIFPGFSWHNLKRDTPVNQIPRKGGRLLWRQSYNAWQSGATMLKIAMFDEVNEGTAVFKAASTRDRAPEQGTWLTLDADGQSLPSDWYLRLSGEITKVFHGAARNRPEMPQ